VEAVAEDVQLYLQVPEVLVEIMLVTAAVTAVRAVPVAVATEEVQVVAQADILVMVAQAATPILVQILLEVMDPAVEAEAVVPMESMVVVEVVELAFMD
jgi:hypothetical protein